MTANLLTDRKIATLYQILVKHSQSLKHQQPEKRYQALRQAVEAVLDDNNHPLSSLAESEQKNVYKILNTFFAACPDYKALPDSQKNFFRARERLKVTVIHNHHHYPDYYRNDFLTHWLLLRSISGDSYHRGFYDGSHASGSSTKNDRDGLILIMVILAIAASFCIYYTLSQIANSIERFCFNEGWLQASMTLMGIAAAGVVSTMLASIYASGPIMSLAISGGMSTPAGWAVFGVIALGLIGAAVGVFLTNAIQNSNLQYNHAEALDPSDPYRFMLTPQEEKNLLLNKIDPIKVKCAMVALRGEIQEGQIPSFFSRFFSNDSSAQKHLDTVRALRKGQLTEVRVGQMHFNLLDDASLSCSHSKPSKQQHPENRFDLTPHPTPGSHKTDHQVPPPSYEEATQSTWPGRVEPSAPPFFSVL